MSAWQALYDNLRAVADAYEAALNADTKEAVPQAAQRLRELRHRILPRLDPSSSLTLAQALALPVKRQAASEHWPVIEAAATAIVELLFAPAPSLKHLLAAPDDAGLLQSWEAAWGRWRRAWKVLGELESLLLLLNPRPAEVPRRGRKPCYDPRADAELARAWEEAKAAGVDKKQFCRDRGLRLAQLNRLLNRVRKRRSGAE